MRLLCSAHTDSLAFLPMQWGEFSLTRDTLLRIPIREQSLAPSIVLIRRPDFPLAPTAEFFRDVMDRYASKGTQTIRHVRQ